MHLFQSLHKILQVFVLQNFNACSILYFACLLNLQNKTFIGWLKFLKETKERIRLRTRVGPDIETIRLDIQQYNLLHFTTKIPTY